MPTIQGTRSHLGCHQLGNKLRAICWASKGSSQEGGSRWGRLRGPSTAVASRAPMSHNCSNSLHAAGRSHRPCCAAGAAAAAAAACCRCSLLLPRWCHLLQRGQQLRAHGPQLADAQIHPHLQASPSQPAHAAAAAAAAEPSAPAAACLPCLPCGRTGSEVSVMPIPGATWLEG